MESSTSTAESRRQASDRVSVVIPAYNEAGVIGRLLDALDVPGLRDHLEVVVACNGCTDDTEAVARAHPLAPAVLSLAEGSKHRALVAGDAHATAFPRFYVDADVVVGASDLLAMADHLEDHLVVAPGRVLRTERSAWVVRSYYTVWAQLPAVREGLFGRGVIGVSREGFLRLGARPEVLGDDLWVDQTFSDAERVVDPSAGAEIQAPRTVGDLLRRRVRAQQGNRQLAARPTAHGRGGSGPRDVVRIVRSGAASPVAGVVFVAVTLGGRLLARARRDDVSWLRDESSRAD